MPTSAHGLVSFLALVAACRDSNPTPGTATVLVESAPEGLDRRSAQSAVAQRLTDLITPGLVTFDDFARPIGDLAESIEEQSPLVYVVRLRPNLRFSTGDPLTSDDVVATFRSLADPAISSPLRSRLELLSSVEAEGDRKVVFTLKEPFAPFVSELVIGILPRQLVSAANRDEVAHRPIGAGPFHVVRWDDEELELAGNVHYYGGPPGIEHLLIRTVRDETTRVLELLKGRADLAVGEVSPELIPVLRDSPRLGVQDPGGGGYAYLTFNLRQGPTADVRVRQAIDCALDREEIVAAKFKGLAHPAAGMLPPRHWAYSPTASCGHDPRRARKLLDEAGYTGRRVHLVYKTSTDRFREAVALVVAEQLRQVGIDAEVRAEEFSTFFAQVQHGNYEMASLKWATVMEPDLMRWVFACRMVPDAPNQFSGWNRGGYCNPDLDTLLDSAIRVTSEAERRALYARAQEILSRDLPYVPLWHEDAVAVVSKRLTGFSASPHGLLSGLAHASLSDWPGPAR
jgi:peptide/nickel transport system substrate-binding protein